MGYCCLQRLNGGNLIHPEPNGSKQVGHDRMSEGRWRLRFHAHTASYLEPPGVVTDKHPSERHRSASSTASERDHVFIPRPPL